MKKIKKFCRRQKNLLVGMLVVLILLCTVFGSYGSKKKVVPSAPLILHATYNKADGLNIGASVRLAGVEVAKVNDVHLDDFYRVQATFAFPKKIDLPADSAAIIETDGLIGNKYVELLPGGDEELLENGDTFMYAQDVLLLDELLERFLMYVRNKKGIVISKEGEEYDS